ncbi:MAG: ATPase domain-containing protein [Promethearchaeota archaeon]
MNKRGNKLEKALADATLKRKELVKNFHSSGIREFDEMLGGGFAEGTLTLIQQDIGCGGEIILNKMIELQLQLSNVVLVILTDPTAMFIEEKLKKLEEEFVEENSLIILNLARTSIKNINVLSDKHEVSLRIRAARENAIELLKNKRENENDEEIQLFIFIISLNSLVLNLSNENLIRVVHDFLLDSIEQKTIDIILLNKGIVSKEMNAKIQSLCHGVIDLSAYYEGVQKKTDIKILKLTGRFHDLKIEPYILAFDENTNEYKFFIKSAFLTSFDTFKNLLAWNKGSIFLSKVPYIITPINYIDSFLDIPRIIDSKKGKIELLERAQGIGRRMSIMAEKLYFLEGYPLFKSTLQMASLMGWGQAEIEEFEEEENLIKIIHIANKEFKAENFQIFLEGFYRGIILRTLNKKISYIEIHQEPIENIETQQINGNLNIVRQYHIIIKCRSNL